MITDFLANSSLVKSLVSLLQEMVDNHPLNPQNEDDDHHGGHVYKTTPQAFILSAL